MQFTDAIIKNKPINIFHKGILKRDFTYIDDIVKGIKSLFINNRFKNSFHKIYNLGNNRPVSVNKIVSIMKNFK